MPQLDRHPRPKTADYAVPADRSTEAPGQLRRKVRCMAEIGRRDWKETEMNMRTEAEEYAQILSNFVTVRAICQDRKGNWFVVCPYAAWEIVKRPYGGTFGRKLIWDGMPCF